MVRLGFLLAAVAITAIAAAYDWRKGEIPNWVTLGPFALGLVVHGILGALSQGARGALWSVMAALLGAIACGLVPVFLWWKGAIGGGDVKLLIALGALLGPMLGIEAELFGFIAAAVYAPARLAYDGKLLRTLGNTAALALNPVLPKNKRKEVAPEMMTWLRFGPPMFVGMCVTVLLNWRGP
jgi:prepilin peptidase CpaA